MNKYKKYVINRSPVDVFMLATGGQSTQSTTLIRPNTYLHLMSMQWSDSLF